MKTVRDIMQQDVATVTPDTTVASLTRFLSDRGISGAPVVTESGALVGVVSATDVIRRAADDGALSLSDRDGTEAAEAGMYYMPDDPEWTVLEWTSVDLDGTPDELTVEDIMTPVSFGVSPDSTLREAADFMVRGRIHRALVLDGTRLIGLVSAMDILRAVADGATPTA